MTSHGCVNSQLKFIASGSQRVSHKLAPSLNLGTKFVPSTNECWRRRKGHQNKTSGTVFIVKSWHGHLLEIVEVPLQKKGNFTGSTVVKGVNSEKGIVEEFKKNFCKNSIPNNAKAVDHINARFDIK
jgi:hypothetical protein